MSVITLNEAKAFLDVIHSADDDKIELLLDAAIDEASQFLNSELLHESSSEPLPGSIKIGVLLLLQANYQATPDEAHKLRQVAEIKLQPHRAQLGF